MPQSAERSLQMIREALEGVNSPSSQSSPSAGFTTARIVLNSASAVLISAPNANKKSIKVRNMDATIAIYVGEGAVTSSNGFPLFGATGGGESVEIRTIQGIYAIAASGTPSVAVLTELGA